MDLVAAKSTMLGTTIDTHRFIMKKRSPNLRFSDTKKTLPKKKKSSKKKRTIKPPNDSDQTSSILSPKSSNQKKSQAKAAFTIYKQDVS